MMGDEGFDSDAEELKAMRGLYTELRSGIQECTRLAMELKAEFMKEKRQRTAALVVPPQPATPPLTAAPPLPASHLEVAEVLSASTALPTTLGSTTSATCSTAGDTFNTTGDASTTSSAATVGALGREEDRRGFAVFSLLSTNVVPTEVQNPTDAL